MGKGAEAVNPTGTLLDAILDEAFSHDPVPVPDVEARHERMRQFHAYGSEKAKEVGLGLEDVTATVRATVKNPEK